MTSRFPPSPGDAQPFASWVCIITGYVHLLFRSKAANEASLGEEECTLSVSAHHHEPIKRRDLPQTVGAPA